VSGQDCKHDVASRARLVNKRISGPHPRSNRYRYLVCLER
jgi:hypothetical protein